MMNQGNVTISRRWLLIGGVGIVVIVALIWYLKNYGTNSQNAGGTSSGSGTVPTILTISPTAPGTPGPSWGHAGHISSGAGEGQAASNAVQYPGGVAVPAGGTPYVGPTNTGTNTELFQVFRNTYGPGLTGQSLNTALADTIAANNYPGGLDPGAQLYSQISPGATITLPQIPYSSLYPNSAGSTPATGG